MVDIIIVTYNAKNKLRRCINSVKKHTKEYLLTVVDNCSRDGTSQYLKRLKNVNVIRAKKNLGFSAGANLGLKKTNNEFVVLLDDDTEVTENWLIGLSNHIKNKPKVGIVGCKIIFPDNTIHAADYRVKPLYIAGLG